ncbi:hypothetical protein [Desulfovibrio fairfieldensis]|uniref:Uncharacterized protein n=1 Tax=Desulfovibrio fairfieldensis TaxID=44742 RepID=A0A0X8JIK8_9BACT|nr:hypothetical protein [Desulfovibrio fairfieldensis]AMD89500.1 hypothetical protein AXF13_04875 [Desulfovibrio fairfieldensis]
MSQASVPVANGYKAFGGTTAQWAASDDRLKYREMGVEYTPDGLVLIKFGIKTEGDVGTPWSELPYSSGPAGPSPAVEWDGPRLRVKNTDGTWTGWVNLQGPSVDYMWTGTSLKLKNPDGTWGDPVDLRGEPGLTGTSVPSTPSSLGGVMPRAGLSVDPDGYLDQDLTWSNRQCYRTPILVLHNGAAYKWLAVNGLGTDAGVKEPGVSGSENFWKSLAAEALEEVRSIIEEQELLRKLSIGCPKFWRSTTLPANHAYPDGSLILFDDWPEFKAVYDAGGFAGMLMPWDADAATQAANLGKFRPDAANPTGLYLPLHGGQFFRNWVLGAEREAGSSQLDALQQMTGSVKASRLWYGGDEVELSGVFSSVSHEVGNAGPGGVISTTWVFYSIHPAWSAPPQKHGP